MSIWCQICNELKSCDNAIQLIPCLHTFCKSCVNETSKTSKVCPMVHCYSSINAPDIINSICEGERCLSKIGTPEILRTACHHDICQNCFDMAARRDKLSCPAPGCGEPMLDDADLICLGPCQQSLSDKSVTLPCCGARMCEECAAKVTNGGDFCEAGKCIVKDASKKKKTIDSTRHPCQCATNCEGEVLRNFPSEFECDHDVCITCLARMLDECEQNGKSPHCPNNACGIPYRCDSVLALNAQFPERKDFFSKFTLTVQFSMQTLKDDTVTNILKIDEAPVIDQKFTLKIGHCDDDDSGMPMDFVLDGCLGDLIREIRRVLKVLATDKIYGYYSLLDDGIKPLEVNQTTIKKTCSELGISEKTTILVDTSGIVARKSKKG